MPEAASSNRVEVEQLKLFEGGPDMRLLRMKAARLASARRAVNTVRAYAAGWADFATWCSEAGRRALPASSETVQCYIAARMETVKVATIEQRLAAIVSKHKEAGDESPVDEQVRAVMSGARRTLKQQPEGKEALTPEQLRDVVRKLPKSALGARDRAVLLLGFALGARRAEIAALDVGDVHFASKGVRVLIRAGKTDQEGKGREVGVFRGRRRSTCPVRALQEWLHIRGRKPGALFLRFHRERMGGRLGARSIAEVVKRGVESVGLDPAAYGAHSMRAGLVTAATAAGVAESVIMQRTGHRSLAVLQKYVRPAKVFWVDPLAKAL